MDTLFRDERDAGQVQSESGDRAVPLAAGKDSESDAVLTAGEGVGSSDASSDSGVETSRALGRVKL